MSTKPFLTRELGRTVLFSLAVVSFVIGTYQVVLQNNQTALIDNYWLFMISFVCTLLHRFSKPKPEAKPAMKPAPTKPGKPAARPKRRS